MRRFLTTLMILLVVLVAGLSALVLLVNPNDFRDYMVKQVAARSGYQLQLDGDRVGTSGRSLVSSPAMSSPPRAREPATGSRRQHAPGRGAFTTTQSSTER